MYNQSYEDYVKMVLGVNPVYNNPYTNYARNDYYFNNIKPTNTYNTYGAMSREQLESFYPDIYNTIYPLVVRTWDINTKPITNELIDQITDEIYNSIEDESRGVMLNINLTNEVRSRENDKKTSENKEIKQGVRAESEEIQINYLLKDLIRILVVKNLIERRAPTASANRPPMYGNFPGGAESVFRPNMPPMGM